MVLSAEAEDRVAGMIYTFVQASMDIKGLQIGSVVQHISNVSLPVTQISW